MSVLPINADDTAALFQTETSAATTALSPNHSTTGAPATGVSSPTHTVSAGQTYYHLEDEFSTASTAQTAVYSATSHPYVAGEGLSTTIYTLEHGQSEAATEPYTSAYATVACDHAFESAASPTTAEPQKADPGPQRRPVYGPAKSRGKPP